MAIEKNKKIESINDILIDGSNNWQEKKLKSLEISKSYLRLGEKNELTNLYDIGVNMHYCGNKLAFQETESGEKKLLEAKFCRARLCPMCSWRRSKKVFGQVSKIIEEINKEKQLEYIFLTLTCKNVQASELNDQLKHVLKSFNEMTRNTRIKKMCKGYFRGVEVTYNQKANNYHPHIHTIIAVNKSYFTDKTYIKQKDLVLLWQKYLKVDYLPVVDVRRFEDNNYKAVAEVSKYTVKYKDMAIHKSDGTVDEEKSDQLIYDLHFALKRKRLVGMGGIFKEMHKKLNLEDLNKDDIDLINTDNEKDDDKLIENIITCNWCCGVRNYIVERKIKSR